MRLLRAGLLPVMIFAVMMVPFVNGWTSLVESSAIGAMAAFACRSPKGPDDTRSVRKFGTQHAWDHLHVHVDHSRGPGLWRGV